MTHLLFGILDPFLCLNNMHKYSHNCYIYNTITALQIHTEVTNYMSMFFLIFLRNRKKVNLEKKLKGEKIVYIYIQT